MMAQMDCEEVDYAAGRLESIIMDFPCEISSAITFAVSDRDAC